MPIYEYQCSNCVNTFSAQNSVSNYQQPASCPECGGLAPRIVSTPPQLNAMNPSLRKAFQVNEKSAHEPGVRHKHHCGSSCGCGSSTKPTDAATQQAPALVAKQQLGKRPWMLGH